MRVVLLNFSGVPSRSTHTIQIVSMCGALAEVPGLQVTLIAPRAPTEKSGEFQGTLWEFYGQEPTFKVRLVPVPLWVRGRSKRVAALYSVAGGLLALLREGAREGDDFVVFTRALKVSRWLRYLSRLPGGRYQGGFCELHDLPDHVDYLRYVRGAVTTSETLRQDVLEQTDALPPDRVRTVQNGTTLSEAQGADTSAVRAQLGLSPQARLVVYTGRLIAGKGAEVLVDAFLRLGEYPDIHLLLVGKIYDEVRARLPSPDRLGRVSFLGFVPPAEVRQYQQCADVLVLPSTRELGYDRYTSPLKLFEYMATGRPLVTSQLEGISEVIEHGRNGLLVPPGDPAALADALRALLDDPDLGRRLAGQALEDVRLYTWEERAKRVASFIREALA